MNAMVKLVLSLGNKVIGIVVLTLSCAAVTAGFLWEQQLSTQYYQDEQESHQKQVAMLLNKNIASRVENIEKQMRSVASSPQVASILLKNNSVTIEKKQRELAVNFPNAIKVCLIPAHVDDVDPKACTSISFATLNSLRLAKKEGMAPIGLMRKGTDDAHILLAHRIVKGKKIVGVLVVTLAAERVNDILGFDANFSGYIELQQGMKKVATLASLGDASNKQGIAPYTQAIPNTYWKIAYWPPTSQQSMPLSMAVPAGVLLIIILAWFFREGVRNYLLKRDVATLRAQLVDLQAGTLKPKYPLSFAVMKPIAGDVQALARENYHAQAKKGATADSISKKMEEQEHRNSGELDLLQEGVDIDPSLFKANDIRGIVGHNLTEDVVRAIGHAIGSEAIGQGQNRLVVGRDGRLSSADLSHALIEGILASGCDVLDIGEVPTPVLYYTCEKMGTHSGVMVTGSHNPAEYNGLKIMLANQMLSEDKLQLIYQRVEQSNMRMGEGKLSETNVIDDYIGRIASDIRLSRPIKVVIDCGNGIAGAVAPILFKTLGCEVIELHCTVDGNFPNHHPNPSDPENLHDLTVAVKQHGAELGLAFDGDGDRLGVVDGYGAPVWPDRLMMLFSQDVLSRVPGGIIVYDVKCSNLLGEEISKSGGEALMTKSGYAFIKNKMQDVDSPLAGELSGHIFFKERWYGFDDGLYAASRLLELLSNDLMQRRATEIFSALPSRESTAEIIVEMGEGESQPFIRQLAGEGRFDGAEVVTIDGIRAEYPNGWGLVRSSNTMPGLSLRFEADSADELHDIQQRFKQQMLQIKPTLTLLF
ncbi:MAG: phosphomannomutase/phosphoglucomutase [Gammaproteobacteria bacterium]|nr:phosphomannomutase/phosphoglucomutase [Gammaproteobacteria bacterium]